MLTLLIKNMYKCISKEHCNECEYYSDYNDEDNCQHNGFDCVYVKYNMRKLIKKDINKAYQLAWKRRWYYHYKAKPEQNKFLCWYYKRKCSNCADLCHKLEALMN